MKAFGVFSFVIAAWWTASGTLKAESAETVFINGNIHTVNDRQPHAEAIAAKGGRVVFVGSNAEVAKYRTEAERIVDRQGQTVVPGMTDAH